ncbi:MAG TPA: RNA methyltransferase [Holophagaceae bacterium]|nr:RNA methyltransferase [Holophagaceae bacterium]
MSDALRALFADLRFGGTRLDPDGGTCFVAEGRILVEDLLAWGRAGRVDVVAVLAEEGQAEAARTLLPQGTALLTATKAELEQLTGFPFHRGLLAAARVPEPRPLDALAMVDRLLVLPATADAENLGQLLRTAAALGLEGAVLGPGPDPFSRRAVRVSMGASWKLPLWQVEDPWGALGGWKADGGEVVGAALPGSVPAADWHPGDRTALVLGPEGPGLSEGDLARCDRTVRIPMAPGVDSLNVAAAGAILMAKLAGAV